MYKKCIIKCKFEFADYKKCSNASKIRGKLTWPLISDRPYRILSIGG